MTTAVIYLRVSSSEQVKGDGFARQREACTKRAEELKLEIVAEFKEDITGTCPMHDRPGLSALMDRIVGNGVDVILVEKAERMARDLIEGELIYREMRKHSIRVIDAESGTDLTKGDADNPTLKFIRQVLGAVAEFEKDALVAKLRAARRRKGVKEGRKRYGTQPHEQLILSMAREGRELDLSLAKIAETLNDVGHRNSAGRPWTVSSVSRLLQRDLPPAGE